MCSIEALAAPANTNIVLHCTRTCNHRYLLLHMDVYSMYCLRCILASQDNVWCSPIPIGRDINIGTDNVVGLTTRTGFWSILASQYRYTIYVATSQLGTISASNYTTFRHRQFCWPLIGWCMGVNKCLAGFLKLGVKILEAIVFRSISNIQASLY